MSTLLDDLDAEVADDYQGRCPVRLWLSELKSPVREQAEAVVASTNPKHTAGRAIDFLRRKVGPVPFGDSALQAHRRNLDGRSGCQCPSSTT